MKGKRRDRLEIFYEVLRKCQYPTVLTKIMQSVSESYTLITSFLKEMEKSGLLTKKGAHWQTTEKGKEYLKRFEEIKKLLEG